MPFTPLAGDDDQGQGSDAPDSAAARNAARRNPALMSLLDVGTKAGRDGPPKDVRLHIFVCWVEVIAFTCIGMYVSKHEI